MKHDDIKEYTLPFAAWELRLYLNTHPDDAEAFAKYKALCASMGDKCSYACHTEQRRPMPRENGCGCEGSTRDTVRDSGCGCEVNSRNTVRDGGCGCEVNSRNTVRDGGCGCEHGANFANGQNYGGGNYGGRRNDGGNFDEHTRKDAGCGCGGGTDNGNRQHIWSWIDGPWPWEPEANITGGKC